MDIETKRFRIRSGRIVGQVEILDKATGATAFVDPTDVPSINALAMMSERRFDQTMERLSHGC